MKKTSIILLIVLLCSPFFLNLQVVHADEPATLADAINNVLSNIQTTDAWTCVYNQIFGLQNQSAFDTAITQALSQNDYQDVIFIARLAELNGYTSTTINDSVIVALQNFPMCGSLPITCWANSYAPDSFQVYDRYMINAYRYAQELNVSGWNINQAFTDFATQYLKPPTNSQSGEMLWINPQENFSESFSISRYYDEHAETLDMFLEFALAGVNATISYNGQTLNVTNFMDDAWINTQSHWDGSIYGYDSANGWVECEMGNFAQVIAEYQNFRGNLTYFDRVIQDLEYKLLAENFSSPAWGTVGVLKHADGNPQLRLGETMGALTALQMLYPDFNQTMQANFRGMLENGAWQGLINSTLYNDGQFSFVNNVTDNTEQPSFGDDASSLGAMTLFLDGIVPDTGYLAINASNEAYQDYRTCFPTSEWSFNYQYQTIRIPVMQGNLSFIFGSHEVTQNFPENGVYNIQFASDWNSIVSVTKAANINSVTLQPITLQAISRPTPTPTPSPTPTLSPKPTPSPTPNSTPSLTPSPTPTLTSTPMPSQKPSDTPMQAYVIVFIMSAAFGSATALYYVKRKNRQVGTLGNKNLRTFICRNKKRL